MPKEISSKELDVLKMSIDVEAIENNNSYYIGENPTITNENPRRKPDNKVPVAFGYRLISSLAGYAARTGDIFINQVPTDKKEDDTDESEFEQARKDIDEANDGLLLNSQLYIEVLKQGIAYEVVWTTLEGSDLKIKYAQIPNHQSVPVWSKELETVQTLQYFVRFWSDEIIAGSTEAQAQGLSGASFKDGKVTVYYAQVFETGGYQIYKKIGADKTWSKDGEFISQPFDNVQVSVYRGNKNARSYFQPVKVLMDQYDKVVSRNMNEVERFNNSILGVLKKVPPDVKSKIDEYGLIDNLIDGLEDSSREVFPKYITRDVPSQHAELMLETLGRLIYEIMGSPNFTAESFGTASGVALLYRLIGLEYSASETDVWYDQGLMNRDGLINQALRTAKNNDKFGEEFTPVIVHNRNLPVDIGFLAENALKLKAIGVSMETILSLFPKSVIADVKREMERLEESTVNLDDMSDSDINE